MDFLDMFIMPVGMIFYFVLYGFIALTGIATYVLSSLSLYTIAKRRGLARPWLAWIPIGNVWILGSISDQYQQQMKNKKTKRRKILLGMEIAGTALAVLYVIFCIVIVVVLVGSAVNYSYNSFNEYYDDYYYDDYYDDYYYDDYNIGSELAMAGSVIVLYIGLFIYVCAMSALAIAESVFMYMSYYDLYMSCDSDKAVLFLVLSMLVPYTLPVLLFIVRKKDDGMLPPQTEEQPEDQECLESADQCEPVMICAQENETQLLGEDETQILNP